MDSHEAAELGRSLRRIRADVVAHPRDGKTLVWYQGAGIFFDLFLERTGDAAIGWLQMTRAGRYVECDFDHRRLTTGQTGDQVPREVGHPHSRALSPDSTADVDLLDELIRIVASRTGEPTFDALSGQLSELRSAVARPTPSIDP